MQTEHASTDMSATEVPTTEVPTTAVPTTAGPGTVGPTTEWSTTEGSTTEGSVTEWPTTADPTETPAARLPRSPARPLRRLREDSGAATAEYLVATMAAVGFAGLLIVILRGDEVRGILTELVRTALSVG